MSAAQKAKPTSKSWKNIQESTVGDALYAVGKDHDVEIDDQTHFTACKFQVCHYLLFVNVCYFCDDFHLYDELVTNDQIGYERTFNGLAFVNDGTWFLPFEWQSGQGQLAPQTLFVRRLE